MNKIKARTKDGKTVLLSCEQHPKPNDIHGTAWNSPAAVKAKALRMGLVLTGKRQA